MTNKKNSMRTSKIPKFSIIVPIYNVEKYLPDCIESVLNQTYKNYELILIDDGSTDQSGNICDEFKKKSNNIIVIHKENGGLSDARNTGILIAHGEKIIFLDSDDYWTNKYLLENINKYNSTENCLIIWQYQRTDNKDVSYIYNPVGKVNHYQLQNDFEFLFRSGKLLASACFLAIPRNWFDSEEMLFIKGDTSEDIEWFANVLLHTTTIFDLNFPFYYYRIREGSISSIKNDFSFSCLIKHLRYLYSIAKNDPILQVYLAEQVANFLIVSSRCNLLEESIIISMYEIFTFLKYSVRPRSRLIFIAYKLFGINKTIKLLHIVDKLRRIQYGC